MQRRSEGPILDPEIVFPPLGVLEHPTKLPSIKSVICVLRYLTAENKYSHNVAIQEVSKLVYAKWYHDTVYCLNVRTIHRKIETLWKTFKEGKRRYLEKRTGAAVDNYKKIVGDAQKLFDVHADDEEQCKKQWGVSMTQRERLYYQDI